VLQGSTYPMCRQYHSAEVAEATVIKPFPAMVICNDESTSY